MISDRSSEIQSMNYWATACEGLNDTLQEFFADIQREEQEKAARLANVSTAVGLPIYPTASFCLPEDLIHFINTSRQITASGDWQLAIRFAQTHGRVVYRRLGVTSDAAIEAARSHSATGPIVASVTPYREPEQSGTFWAQNGEILLELALGPHYWISKWEPSTEEVLRCRFSAFSISGLYSTMDVRRRKLLYTSAKSASRLVLGCSLREVTRLWLSVYAEFHWHKTIGYRYIECSFSKGWTASSTRLEGLRRYGTHCAMTPETHR